MTQYTFDAIGTQWVIDIQDVLSDNKKELLFTAIKDRVVLFDATYSRFKSDSLITIMSQKAGEYTLPDDAKPLFDLYHHLYKVTNGSLTPLIGKVMEDAGYDPSYSLVPKTLTTPPTWDEALLYSFPSLVVKVPVLLDVGAAGKGYLVDIVSDIVRSYGVESFCVDAGADVFYQNQQGELLSVGLEHPENFEQVVGVAHILNQSICGSAGNRRAWAQFHHIINPHTLESPRHILATWAIAPTALLADALASCLFFTPSSILLEEYTFEYVVLYADYSVDISAQFPGDLFINPQ